MMLMMLMMLLLSCPGDMFAGVGPIAVVAAKKVKFVYANDLNPTATAYMQQNLSTNKLAYKAEVESSFPSVLACP